MTPDPRVQGFPGQLLGGYLAGLAADSMGHIPVTVTLRRPVPSDTAPLHAVSEGARVRWLDASGEVALDAMPVEDVGPRLPAPPAAADVPDAGPSAHPVPTCFGCGQPSSGPGLGVRVGMVADRSMVAGVWTPPADLADGGIVPSPLVWAALDCPGFWALLTDPPAASHVVTGRLTGWAEPVVAGEPHVITARVEGRAGRRITVAAALHRPDGVPAATVRQVLVATGWGFPVASLRENA
jgi:hypothetical protein